MGYSVPFADSIVGEFQLASDGVLHSRSFQLADKIQFTIRQSQFTKRQSAESIIREKFFYMCTYMWSLVSSKCLNRTCCWLDESVLSIRAESRIPKLLLTVDRNVPQGWIYCRGSGRPGQGGPLKFGAEVRNCIRRFTVSIISGDGVKINASLYMIYTTGF